MVPLSVGRIVHFYSMGGRTPDEKPSGPYAGIITGVHSERCVNLGLWESDGTPSASPPTSIIFRFENEEAPLGCSYCEFPPRV